MKLPCRPLTWLLVGIGVLVAVPLLGVALINTSWGQRQVSKQVKLRTGLSLSYDSIQPSDVDTVRISGASFHPQLPISIQDIEIDLNLLQSLKAQSILIDGITLDTPVVSIEAEALVKALKEHLARGRSVPPPQAKPPPENNPATEQEEQTPPNPAKQPKPNSKPSPKKPPGQASSAPPPPASPPFPVVQIKNASVNLYSQAHSKLSILLDKISYRSDASTRNRTGVMAIGGLKLGGQEIELNLVQPISLEYNHITIPRTRHEIKGVQASLYGKLMTFPGLPFVGEIRLGVQEKQSYRLHLIPEAEISLRDTGSILAIRGSLANPLATIAQFATRSQGVTVGYKEHEQDFRKVVLDVQLANGALYAPVVHLVSDDLSILSNGLATSRGNAAAVVRLVASDQWQERLSTGSSPLRFEPIDTPDRAYTDLYLNLNQEAGLQYRSGADQDWSNLDSLMELINGLLNQNTSQ